MLIVRRSVFHEKDCFEGPQKENNDPKCKRGGGGSSSFYCQDLGYGAVDAHFDEIGTHTKANVIGIH